MNIEDCIRVCGALKRFDVRALALRVGEAYEKHMNEEKLTKIDRFVLGLRYYEFFATKTDDNGYTIACNKQQLMLEKLGLEPKTWFAIVKEMTGLE